MVLVATLAPAEVQVPQLEFEGAKRALKVAGSLR
jgi:hypothetical protein